MLPQARLLLGGLCHIVRCVKCLLVLLAAVACSACREPPPRWVTAKLRRGELAQTVNATGTIQPVVLSPVGSQASGIVWKLHADFNDPVKKGQVLLELDPALFRTAVAQAEANVLSARADVARAEAALQDAQLIAGRSQALAEKHYVAQSDSDTAAAKAKQAEADLLSMRARVRQAEAALEKARVDLRNSVIASPVDGVVVERKVELGQAVAASFQAPNLFSIAQDLKLMQVLANVDEADIGMVKVGQGAQFSVDAFRGRRFAAKVSQVRNAPQTLQNVVTYVVVLDVDNGELLLKPGMTANVRMEVARREQALLLPNAALRFKPPLEGPQGGRPHDGGKGRERPEAAGRDPFSTRATVYAPDGKGVRAVPIVTGITDGMETELLQGLAEGDEVIVGQAKAGGAAGGGAPKGGGPMGGGMRRVF